MNPQQEENVVEIISTPSDEVITSTPPKKDGFFVELIKFILIAVVIILPIRLFIAQPFIVSGASMYPTFDSGDYLIVDELSYHLGDPERGEVVIFKYPNDPKKFFIKRVIALPGETIKITGTNVTIVNDEHPAGMVLDEPFVEYNRQSDVDMTLGENEYFVMGDNRFASSDSRVWGALEREFIVGRAFLQLFPITKIDVFPGAHEITSK